MWVTLPVFTAVDLRRLLFRMLSLVLLSSFSLIVEAKTVSDPNHKGWTGKHPRSKQVVWKPISTKCPSCVKITEQYNQTVQALLISRYWVNFWRQVHKNREKGKKDPFWPGKGDIGEFEGKAVGANLELFEYQSAQLDLHRTKVYRLEQQAQYLSQAITECERSSCPGKKPSKKKKIKIGGETSKVPFQPNVADILNKHGINWKGPYSTDCLPCKPIVDKLNALPDWVARADMQLQNAESTLEYKKLIDKSNQVKLEFLKYSHPDKSDYSGIVDEVARLKSELLALKQLFEELLFDLEDCLKKNCPANEEDATSMCPDPASNVAITVGANSDVGSKANFKEKAKKKAAGLATKAITGLLGIGGGGGGGAEGPTTYKDPVKKKTKFKNKKQKRELRLGGVFTPDGLLISNEIKKAPGKGTFQTVYMENIRGWQLLPIRIFMYEIWRDWKLNVSWTRDTYIDGQHVKHEEGGWSESWRELIAKGEQIEYGEFPIWEQLGFTTAVSGARSIGTLFPVSPQMLANEPFNLVVHISDPKKDPVITFPYVFHVSLDNRGKVVIEEAEETLASGGTPCEETPTIPSPSSTIAGGSTEQPPTTGTAIVGAPTSINIGDGTEPNFCPNGWACRLGMTCPPIENCTNPGPGTQPPSVEVPPDDISTINEDDIEEIEVTGSRIKRTETPPAEIPDGGIDEIEEIDVTGTRIRNTPPTPSGQPAEVPSNGPDPEDIEEIEITGTRIKTTTPDQPVPIDVPEIPVLEEVPVTGTRIRSFDEYSYDGGYKSKYGLSTGLEYNLEYDTDTPEYGIEEDPPIIGIALKSLEPDWVPRYGNYVRLAAKMYVPHGTQAGLWVPHNTVQRVMEITFIARSNEKGKAINANLRSSPQTTPDVFFKARFNADSICTDDGGGGRFGTCTTKQPQNEHVFSIDSEDYGAFSRLDVSCEGCVPLRLLKGDGAFGTPSSARVWGTAITEMNRELRAVYVPKDDNRNQISDAYLPDRISPKGASYDGESVPIGNGKDGDGLTAYEEYRGFITRYGAHERTDWEKKSLVIENNSNADTELFEKASGLNVIEIDEKGHRGRIVNYNFGHAHKGDQHGLLLQVTDNLDEGTAGKCFCGLDRPKTARRVTVRPAYKYTPTSAHELGHAVGMHHHGEVAWPEAEEVRFMTGGIRDLFPGAVHSDPRLCGRLLPSNYKIGTKGDQGSGHTNCIMRYYHEDYVYLQDGGDYDCMPKRERTMFDDSTTGTGPNGFQRTASDASVGNCLSQMWINSQ